MERNKLTMNHLKDLGPFFQDLWGLVKNTGEPDNSDGYWNELITRINDICQKYQHSELFEMMNEMIMAYAEVQNKRVIRQDEKTFRKSAALMRQHRETGVKGQTREETANGLIHEMAKEAKQRFSETEDPFDAGEIPYS